MHAGMKVFNKFNTGKAYQAGVIYVFIKGFHTSRRAAFGMFKSWYLLKVGSKFLAFDLNHMNSLTFQNIYLFIIFISNLRANIRPKVHNKLFLIVAPKITWLWLQV